MYDSLFCAKMTTQNLTSTDFLLPVLELGIYIVQIQLFQEQHDQTEEAEHCLATIYLLPFIYAPTQFRWLSSSHSSAAPPRTDGHSGNRCGVVLISGDR